MKHAIIITLLFAFTTALFGQQITPATPSFTKTDYLRKSKKQQKIAWIMIGGGAALILTSVIIPKGESKGFTGSYYGLPVQEYKNDGIKAAFGLSGVLSILGSIPFFIASGKNKKRANTTSFIIDIEKVAMFQYATRKNQSFPVVGLRMVL